MVSERELVEKWHTQVFRSADEEIRRLLTQFPDRRQLSIPFTQCGVDYRFTAPLVSDPDRTLEAGRQALEEVVENEFDGVEGSVEADDRIYLRLTDVPDSVRYRLESLRAEHLNRLVAVDGTVDSCGDLEPRIVTATFRCERCDERTTVPQRERRLRRRSRCPSCTAVEALEFDPKRSEYVDSQVIQLRDGGRTLPVSLEHELAGSFEPGDELDVVAIPRGRFDGETTTVDVELECVSAHRHERE
ncbi:hypothetical protein OB955_09015 [Halobacteria archaeon AArc-m2/3/4]|uniref:MCM OB domain-containing protein n=1 Tax=Natronoglomus mannanivorans TaxID=2979990 RepID=A0ABT2QD71_9EURY|nr:hypothetical protein [Halobacteria archaeon AArc-m2/3/4]